MTTIALAERFTFAGYDLSTYAVILTAPGAGIDEFPAVRGDDAPLTGLPGRRFLTKTFESRRVGLVLAVLGTNAAGAVTTTPAQHARANLDALYAILGLRTQGALVRLMPDGSTRTAQAEVVNVRNVSDPANHEVFILTVDFQLADPFWYIAALVDSSRAFTVGVPFNLTQAGTAPTHKVLFVLLGTITNPRITNNTTGYYVQYTGTITTPRTVTIDGAAFTAVHSLNGNVINLITHGGGAPFMLFAPGVNSITVTGTSPSGSTLTSTIQQPLL